LLLPEPSEEPSAPVDVAKEPSLLTSVTVLSGAEALDGQASVSAATLTSADEKASWPGFGPTASASSAPAASWADEVAAGPALQPAQMIAASMRSGSRRVANATKRCMLPKVSHRKRHRL
jgi:hypothetical protein